MNTGWDGIKSNTHDRGTIGSMCLWCMAHIPSGCHVDSMHALLAFSSSHLSQYKRLRVAVTMYMHRPLLLFMNRPTELSAALYLVWLRLRSLASQRPSCFRLGVVVKQTILRAATGR
jgi:hypothetical protein